MSSGFQCANLANGTERNHEPTERVSVDALEAMLEVAIALVRGGAGRARGRGRMSEAGSSEFEPLGSEVEWEGKCSGPVAPVSGMPTAPR